MLRRIQKILLVSSPYDLYIMEEEGLLSDRISDEYMFFQLTNAPTITRVSTAEEALEAVKKGRFDIVVTSLRVGKTLNAFEMAKKIKELKPDTPIAMLTSETGRLATIMKRKEVANVDKIFFWQGDARLFLAIVKCFEDIINAQHDCIDEHVRVIILVEDSPQFYSTYLPLIYTEILDQVRELIAEEASEAEKYLRMASRPKILMAETYEKAVEYYTIYKDNVLGVICDRSFPRNGVLDDEAGFAFTELVKNDNRDVPVLIQSKDTTKAPGAAALGASFADKNSPHLLQELRKFIKDYFGFGDFVFRMPDGREVGRANSKREMEKALDTVPPESIEYHAKKNQFSNWLFARGEFEIAAKLRSMRFSDFSSVEEIRQTIKEGLNEAGMKKRKARIARFSEQELEMSTPFIRFGEGSIGGKGRGIAFMSKLLLEPAIAKKIKKYNIFIPRTAALATEVFDRFLERNNLHRVAMEKSDDAEIANSFLSAELGSKIIGQLSAFLRKVRTPLAIRSSSLSEDSLSQPFAGLYATYLIPNNSPDFETRLKQFLSAIKLVYASTFFSNPKAYMEANGIALESEKMAVIIQQIAGHSHGRYFYPDIAGVAQSFNFFPVGYIKPEDGVAQIVLGLGTMAMQGERSLRFSPKYPNILPQYSKPADILKNSQRKFHAVDMGSSLKSLFTDEGTTLASLDISQAAEDNGPLSYIGGTFSRDDNIVYDNISREGQKVLTFKRVLAGKEFPIPEIISTVLEIGASGLGCPVEIEFAANFGHDDEPDSFAFLQVRPLVTGEEAGEVSIGNIERQQCIAISNKAMGNGVFENLRHILYVKPDSFNITKTAEIANDIGRHNVKMISSGDNFVLLGFGRWGTTNPRLGIPVTYGQVSHAKVICELSTNELSAEPSQGTHFFHNIASSRIGYLSIDTSDSSNLVDWEWLEHQSVVSETEYVKLVQLDQPMTTKIDGRIGKGVIFKPVNY